MSCWELSLTCIRNSKECLLDLGSPQGHMAMPIWPMTLTGNVTDSEMACCFEQRLTKKESELRAGHHSSNPTPGCRTTLNVRSSCV